MYKLVSKASNKVLFIHNIKTECEDYMYRNELSPSEYEIIEVSGIYVDCFSKTE